MMKHLCKTFSSFVQDPTVQLVWKWVMKQVTFVKDVKYIWLD